MHTKIRENEAAVRLLDDDVAMSWGEPVRILRLRARQSALRSRTAMLEHEIQRRLTRERRSP